MNILLTGGAGYIGSNTALALLDRGHQITIIDNLRENSNACCFLDNVSRVSFFASALKYTQFACRSLGDFFVISYNLFN